MNQPKVSIIIPVYNLEPYLRRCLDSLIHQTLNDIEIICINDGATDNSLSILKEYEKRDPRIRVIDKKNEGQGIARNIGINMASGEYVGFVDGDDKVEREMYERMFKVARHNDADVQMCTVRWLDGQGNDINMTCDYDHYLGRRFNDETMVFNRHDIADEIFLLNRFSVNKIYKRLFLQKNNILFSPHRQFEDHMFHFVSAIKAERMSIIRAPFYIYYKYRQGSSTTQKNRPLLLFDAIHCVQDKLHEIHAEDCMLKRFDKFKIRWSVTVYYMAHKEVKAPYFSMMKSGLAHVDIRGNPFLSLSERLFCFCIKTMPHGLYKYTDVAISLYINLYNKELKNVMRPFG